jgi:diaminopimelate decarboxylase
MADVRDRHGLALAELNLGGGHAVPYVAGDEDFDLAGFADRISRVVRAECASLRLPVPRLTFEPGRAIVNRAMVTLYLAPVPTTIRWPPTTTWSGGRRWSRS